MSEPPSSRAANSHRLIIDENWPSLQYDVTACDQMPHRCHEIRSSNAIQSYRGGREWLDSKARSGS